MSTEAAQPTVEDLLAEREAARNAARRLTAVLVASAHLLDKPFTNAPGLSPWSRGVSPALANLRAALGMDHAPVELCTAVNGVDVHCTSVAGHPNLTLAGMPFNHGNPEAGVFWSDPIGDPA